MQSFAISTVERVVGTVVALVLIGTGGWLGSQYRNASVDYVAYHQA